MPNSVECKNTSDGLYGYIAGLLEDQPFFRDLVGWLKAGNIEISMFRRLVNKKIEEEWIDAIEACIIPLDNVIRRPSRYIEELDEVKPIELSRNITSRSIQHLAQHTDYISEVKGDEVTPSKILNVYREETMLTYENRFVNTLIRQLYLFVGKRYKEMIKEGAENSTSFDISADFKDGNLTSNIRFGMTVSESAEGAAENDPLLRRVMRLNSVVTMYYNSPFAKEMAGAYVRPPIMRTNALMKNRNLRSASSCGSSSKAMRRWAIPFPSNSARKSPTAPSSSACMPISHCNTPSFARKSPRRRIRSPRTPARPFSRCSWKKFSPSNRKNSTSPTACTARSRPCPTSIRPANSPATS